MKRPFYYHSAQGVSLRPPGREGDRASPQDVALGKEPSGVITLEALQRSVHAYEDAATAAAKKQFWAWLSCGCLKSSGKVAPKEGGESEEMPDAPAPWVDPAPIAVRSEHSPVLRLKTEQEAADEEGGAASQGTAQGTAEGTST